jgi:hypothetical protein
MKRIDRLPDSIRVLPFKERRARMQELVDAALHARDICPISQAWAGNRGHTVGVWRSGGRWCVEVEFQSDESRYKDPWWTAAQQDAWLEQIGLDAIMEAA